MRVLDMADVCRVTWLCQQLDASQLLSTDPPPLSQSVLLSLMQQLRTTVSVSVCWLWTRVRRGLGTPSGLCLLFALSFLQEGFGGSYYVQPPAAQDGQENLQGKRLAAYRALEGVQQGHFTCLAVRSAMECVCCNTMRRTPA